jgi:hypothetical protein
MKSHDYEELIESLNRLEASSTLPDHGARPIVILKEPWRLKDLGGGTVRPPRSFGSKLASG